MTTALNLHSLTVEGRDRILDNDLDALAREYPALVQVFEETQYLRREVERLMEDVWGKQQEIDALR
jgi:hypothetical protein